MKKKSFLSIVVGDNEQSKANKALKARRGIHRARIKNMNNEIQGKIMMGQRC